MGTLPTVPELLEWNCRQYPATLLNKPEIVQLTKLLPCWRIAGNSLQRRFGFSNFHQTMAFVNAVADIAHSADHHPELQVSYSECVVAYTTHSISGLSLIDFACAAKIDALSASESP